MTTYFRDPHCQTNFHILIYFLKLHFKAREWLEKAHSTSKPSNSDMMAKMMSFQRKDISPCKGGSYEDPPICVCTHICLYMYMQFYICVSACHIYVCVMYVCILYAYRYASTYVCMGVCRERE